MADIESSDDPGPEPAAEPSESGTAPITADDVDFAYQAGYDSANTGRDWVKACLAVLTAEIDLSGFDPRSMNAVSDLRVAAAERGARIFRADVEPFGLSRDD